MNKRTTARRSTWTHRSINWRANSNLLIIMTHSCPKIMSKKVHTSVDLKTHSNLHTAILPSHYNNNKIRKKVEWSICTRHQIANNKLTTYNKQRRQWWLCKHRFRNWVIKIEIIIWKLKNEKKTSQIDL